MTKKLSSAEKMQRMYDRNPAKAMKYGFDNALVSLEGTGLSKKEQKLLLKVLRLGAEEIVSVQKRLRLSDKKLKELADN